MLSAARDSKRSPDTGDLLVQIKLVAGARNQLAGGGATVLCADEPVTDGHVLLCNCALLPSLLTGLSFTKAPEEPKGTVPVTNSAGTA